MHALEQGMKTVLVRTVDTDVIVILVGVCAKLATIQPSAGIWVAFGTGKNYTLYSIVHICASLGHHNSQALPMFYAFIGCDTTSSFRGARSQPGMHGRPVTKLQKHSYIWLVTHLRFSTLILTIFKC